MFKRLFFIFNIAFCCYGWTQAPLHSFEFEGLERSYLLHVPENHDGPLPLLLVLHGRTQTATQIMRLTDFNRFADKHGFIALYPNGVKQEWNYVRDLPGYPKVHDDTAFLLALIDSLAETYAIDQNRLYVTGFSNGGFMTQRLICDSDTFAAFASVGAAGFGGMPGLCPNGKPLSLLLIHGTADGIVPFDGLTQTNSRGAEVVVLASVPQTLGFWADYGGCDTNATNRDLAASGKSPDTSVVIYKVTGCPDNHDIVLYAVVGGGHNWPGVAGLIPDSIGGNVNLDFHASEVVWNFFQRQAQP